MKKMLNHVFRAMFAAALLGTAFVGAQSVGAEEVIEASSDKVVIGVSVYNINDAEVQAFRKYFEQYLGLAFDADFLYSGSVSSAEEEAAFIEELNKQGVKGLISFVSSYAETSVPLCDSLGMYYVSGSGTLSPESFATVKDYSTFLGTIGPDASEEKKAGTWAAEQIVAGDADKNQNYFVYTGGSSFGNEMHRLRAVAMMEVLDETYGLPKEKSCEEWAEVESTTTLTTESGNRILLYPGYSDSVEASLALYAEDSYDNVLTVGMFANLMDVIEKAESYEKSDLKVGMIGCFCEDTNEWFHKKDAFGNPRVNSLVGKYGATVAPSFVAMVNAYNGDAADFRDNGEAFELYQPFWYAADVDEFDELYMASESIVENTYSAVEMMKHIKAYNPEADFAQFKAFTERPEV